ncbi:MAG TPA: hypothetical protein VFZ98_07475 [Vicinamibacterales bacterium]
MTRAERQRVERLLHEARTEAYARALFDVDAMRDHLTNEQEIRLQDKYRVVAENAVTRYDNLGLWVSVAEKVA